MAKALKMNIDLSVERLNPQLQDLALKGAFGAYVPTVSAHASASAADVRGRAARSAAARSSTTRRTTYNFTATQGIRWTGATATVNWNNWRHEHRQQPDDPQSALRQHPEGVVLASRSGATGRSTPTARACSRPRSTAGSPTSRCGAATVNTVANTRNAYWDLVYAIQAVESAKTSLALAQKLVEDNKIRVEIGTLAPLDIVSAQAEAASRQQTLVTGEARAGARRNWCSSG